MQSSRIATSQVIVCLFFNQVLKNTSQVIVLKKLSLKKTSQVIVFKIKS